MIDRELKEVLKRATVPEREADYWEHFPERVRAEIQRRNQAAGAQRSPGVPGSAGISAGAAWSWASVWRLLGSKPAFALGAAAVYLALGLLVGFWKGHRAPGDDPQLAAVRKYFHEIEALFPNQLQAIIFDERGTHLALAREPNLPASPPLYLRICGPDGCQRFITFSGQQIRVNGEVCDVLADHQGNVLLVGPQMVWSSAQAGPKAGRYTIEARPLQAT